MTLIIDKCKRKKSDKVGNKVKESEKSQSQIGMKKKAILNDMSSIEEQKDKYAHKHPTHFTGNDNFHS